MTAAASGRWDAIFRRLTAGLLLAVLAIGTAVLLILLSTLAGGIRAHAQDVGLPSFFDSVEMRASNVGAFRKWQGALARHLAEQRQEGAQDCASSASGGDGCYWRPWRRFLDGLRDRDRWQQLVAVNQEMNKRRYVSDPSGWGVEDYWASPGEFLARDAGDCEDFAIAKYMSLKRLGWSDDSLRIAAVQDLERRIGHAVLIAFHDGRAWVLDNQSPQVLEAGRITHYRPMFSINEQFWWRHVSAATASRADEDGASTSAE